MVAALDKLIAENHSARAAGCAGMAWIADADANFIRGYYRTVPPGRGAAASGLVRGRIGEKWLVGDGRFGGGLHMERDGRSCQGDGGFCKGGWGFRHGELCCFWQGRVLCRGRGGKPGQ